MNPFLLLGGALVGNLVQSLFDNLFRTVNAPVRGSIVYCDLAFGYAEHSGIYIGDSLIVHRNGKGVIELVTVSEFLSGTMAVTVYVSCGGNGFAVGNEDTALTAEVMLGTQQDYSLFESNCHQFCSYCLTGEALSTTFTLTQLKHDAQRHLQADQWRAWNLLNK